jgi:hypothetical protein
MRKVTMKEKPGSRESILDKEEDNEFRAFLKDKGELRITYREVQFKETTLMVFRNRSGEACCLLFIWDGRERIVPWNADWSWARYLWPLE